MEMVATASLPRALLLRPGKDSVAAGGVASTRRLPSNKSKGSSLSLLCADECLLAVWCAAGKCGGAAAGKIVAKFELKPAPYALNALEPHISQETMSYHWGKHHRGYVEGLNNQIVGTDLEGVELEDIITRT